MSSASAELETAWRMFLGVPFPDVAGRDAVVDLAAYDASIAGIVSRVVEGGRISDDLVHQLRPDVELRRRIDELNDPTVTDYLARLEELINLTVRADASRPVAGR